MFFQSHELVVGSAVKEKVSIVESLSDLVSAQYPLFFKIGLKGFGWSEFGTVSIGNAGFFAFL